MLLHSAPHFCSQRFSQYGMSLQQMLTTASRVTTSSTWQQAVQAHLQQQAAQPRGGREHKKPQECTFQ
eukprot:CAMPEP_0202415774 /NCGR_PEP_ID=MMETSP1128-20130828/37250_1 /ASSEMBLY_ACC=CAM_ASM_000463 /TAXON_ID=3047 /ORGANISM="Dunaliella tertiolecta, Strain CCMP1320" /LENGTH=67 /DNA_ID=CAMNT_0049022559 /DNA_START=151 /DNA_END=350 /DNA_ORIENTATION=+